MMKFKKILFGLAFLAAGASIGIAPLKAVAPDSKEAAAELNFDPFNPTAVVSTDKVAGATTVLAASSIVAPSAIVTATTPIKPGTVYVYCGLAQVVRSKKTTTLLDFKVVLNTSSKTEITVNYQTKNGTGSTGAIAGKDYSTAKSTLYYAPGQTSKDVYVTVLSGSQTGNKYMTLNLTSASGATIAGPTGTGTIEGN